MLESLTYIGVLFLKTPDITTLVEGLDPFWDFCVQIVDESSLDQHLGNLVKNRTRSADSADIFHRTAIGISDPDTDRDFSIVSDRPVVSKVGTGSCFDRHRKGSIQYTRYPEGSASIDSVGQDLEEEKVRRIFQIREVIVASNDVFEGEFD